MQSNKVRIRNEISTKVVNFMTSWQEVLMPILVEVPIDDVVRNDNTFDVEMYTFSVFENFDW